MADLEQQLDEHFGPLERALENHQLERAALKDVGKVVSKSARKDLAVAIGSDRRMRNFPTRAAAPKFQGKVRFSTKLGEGGKMKFSPAGLWGIVEGGSVRNGNHPGIRPLAPNIITDVEAQILPLFEDEVAQRTERLL